jgi:hypothetical protein
MNLVKAAVAKTHRDLVSCDARGQQLTSGDHAVLAGRESGDELICESSE